MKLRLKCLAISATTKGKGRRVVQINDCITLFCMLQNAKLGEKRFHDFSKSLLAYIKLTTKKYLAIF